MLELRTLLMGGPTRPGEVGGPPESVSYDDARRRAPREPPGVSVTAEVSGTRIDVTAVISNPGEEAINLSLEDVAYATFEPLAAYLSPSEEVSLARIDGEHPSVRENRYVVELPARSQVRVTRTIDLRDYKYHGSPIATVAWELGLIGQSGRATQRGHIQLKLPSRGL